MIVIRLARVGKKNSPAYRVVVADNKRAVKRKFIEIIGNYNPALIPKQVVIAKDRVLFWIERGAQPSLTVHNLMCDLEILPKKNKIKKVYGKKQTKKTLKKGSVAEKAIVPAGNAKIVEENVEPQPEADLARRAKADQPMIEEVKKDIENAPIPRSEIENAEFPDKVVGKEKVEKPKEK